MSFTKKSFAIQLSRLEVFENPKPHLEQYPTDSEIAAEIIWNAALNGDVEGKTVADLGCGTGILGIGCLLMGAKKVVFADVDKDAISLAEKNYGEISKEYDLSGAKAEFLLSDISEFSKKADVVFQNPPFGVQKKHADRVFLEAAFKAAPVVYSLHKAETKVFVEKFSKDKGFRITNEYLFDFPLKMTMKHHTRKIQRIKVSCFRLVRY